ncbi:aromatic acid exporter family protein [Radiobacillus kanasensis]|uniref:aromatic acid exporter family protein n=1 Tax=Radiobacillus kanasensis TaxID=2844358 RepID=UPI001E31D6EA|nr:aromatic acid exporter family protein [Radiobacillus kanasensis]UFT97706.1 aromatic acid exporter family protein [Radiobacillus kanasensis]
MKIGYRTLKTAIGTPVSIWIAELFQLDNFVSAGILTILCIQSTRKRSFLSAWHRIAACLLAILFSSIIFNIIGFHPISIGLLLILFIPVTVKFKVTSGIASSSVILLHLYSAGHVDLPLIVNELGIIGVGMGIALLLNLYMPSMDDTLKKTQDQLEENFKSILYEISIYLREGKQTWSGREIIDTEELLNRSETLVARDVENHIFRGNHLYADYFKMRRKQFDLLKRMLLLVSQIQVGYEQCYRLADFFESLSESVHPGNTATRHLDAVKQLKQTFSEDDLPKSREEFEARATLFRLMYDMEQYLIFKRSFKKSDA